MRREFPKPVKLAAWDRAKERCECCGIKIYGGNGPHYDHIIADGIGGEPTLENCQVLCKTCHLAKTTKEDVPRIAKTKRQRAKHIGAATKRSGFRGWRKMNGDIVWKDDRP